MSAVDDATSLVCVVKGAEDSWLPIISIVLSGIVLVVQVLSFVFSNWINRGRDQSAKVQEAWFKVIVLDDALPSLQSFLATQHSKFLELARTTNQTVAVHRAFLFQYVTDLESLMRRLSISECLSTRAMQSVVLSVEKLDDFVQKGASIVQDGANDVAKKNRAIEEVAAAFDTCHAACTNTWRQLHSAMQKGQAPDKVLPRPNVMGEEISEARGKA